MTRAQRAPLRPRAYVFGSTDTVLVEDEIARLLAEGQRGLVAILGLPGAGKTTALEHLAAVLPPDGRLRFLDNLDACPPGIVAPVRLVVYTAKTQRRQPHVAVYQLAPWTPDDLIEYLLAVHRPRCAAVMARVQPGDHGLLGGAPELWRAVLDRLAEDDALPDVRRALHRHLEAHLCDTDLLERARSGCLNQLLAPAAGFAIGLKELANPGFAVNLTHLLQNHAVQVLLASERIAADLHGEGDCDYLAKRLPRELVKASAGLVANDSRAVEHLHGLLAGPSWSHAISASLVHANDKSWRPDPLRPPVLAGAYLDGASWPKVDLHGQDLRQTDLSAANLWGANLAHVRAWRINLTRACLHRAALDGIMAQFADVCFADVSEASACGGVFLGSNLRCSNFDSAALRNAYFGAARLTKATFRGADLSRARFSGTASGEPEGAAVRWKGADFTDANLTEAVLANLCLRTAVWTGARFTRANLGGCDLEGLALPAADFEGAWLRGALLTGTSMPGADFRFADLRETGLADVDWEGADLRGADLRDCSFHMGSTRSGLVGSPVACEGSRTGFYTDDYDEQTYKAPEEIRKANLCGADLRGANIEGVDFYLVDVRGANYDPVQELQLRRSGAILRTRV